MRECIAREFRRFSEIQLREKHPLISQYGESKRLLRALHEAEKALRKKIRGRLISINVYGSRAKGYARPESDVELAVYISSKQSNAPTTHQVHSFLEPVLSNHGFTIDYRTFTVERFPSDKKIPEDGNIDVPLMFRTVPFVGIRAFLEARLAFLQRISKASETNPKLLDKYRKWVAHHKLELLVLHPDTGNIIEGYSSFGPIPGLRGPVPDAEVTLRKIAERLLKKAAGDKKIPTEREEKWTQHIMERLKKLAKRKARVFQMHPDIQEEIKRQQTALEKRSSTG